MAPLLRKVEKEVVIPRYLEYKINRELCVEQSKKFSECAEAAGLRVVVDCRALKKEFEECSNKHFRDPELLKQVEKEYLEKRAQFRKTGEAEKSPFKRI